MTRKVKRRFGLTALGAMALGLIVVVSLRTGVTQQASDPVAETSGLFSQSYEDGHAVAGFCGRPMLLVFGEATSPWVVDLQAACASDEKLSGFLTESFVGVIVDPRSEPEVWKTYGIPEAGVVLLKDLRGPIRGILKGTFSLDELAEVLLQAAPRIRVEKSPVYTRLLQGPDVLDELVARGATDEAARAVRLFARFEPGTPALAAAEATARELRLLP